MEREKGVVLEEISMCEDDNSDVVLDLLAEGYFGKTAWQNEYSAKERISRALHATTSWSISARITAPRAALFR